jgi:hypothetical protein
MNDEFTLIKTAVFSGVTEVRFYDETIAHIQEHEEIPILLPSLFGSIERVIANPTHVETSYGNSYVFVDTETTNASGDPLRIPVKIIEGTSGRLRSVYFASAGGVPNIVWRRS